MDQPKKGPPFVDKLDLLMKSILDNPAKYKKLFIGFGSIFLLLILFSMCFTYVKPNEYGIKIKLLGMNGGVQKEVYETGLHFVIPTVHVIERFPRDTQVIQLTNYAKSHKRRSKNVTVEKAAHIQTYDGYFVDVDLSVFYHIKDPLAVIKKLGKKGVYEQAIIPKVVPALKQTLGKLTTEEFYNSKMRVEQMHKARDLLSREFEEKGLVVNQVLVRYFVYSKEIQNNIEAKKLKDQLVFKNQAEAKAATEGAKLSKVTQEGAANVAVILEEGKAYVTRKNAEKDAYVRQKKANADLLIKLAEADKVSRKNTALRSGGSDKMVGLEMAKVLQGVESIILPSDGKNGLNPLNLKQTLNTFGVQ